MNENKLRKYRYRKIFIEKRYWYGDIDKDSKFKYSLNYPDIVIPMFITFNNGRHITKRIESKQKKIKYIKFEKTPSNYIIYFYELIRQKRKGGNYSNAKGIRELFKIENNMFSLRSRNIGINKRINVFERDKYICQYCGWKNGTEKGDRVLHIDHIIPVYFGGSNNISNLITACYKCNLSKTNKIIQWENI